jgi:hypothetical protein
MALAASIFAAILSRPNEKSISPALAPLTALYIGCEWDHIPIKIPAGSMINVMWLDPPLLRGNPHIPFVGPFEVVRNRDSKALEWPNKESGRWMTRAEVPKVIANTNSMPNPYAFRCTLNNYAITLDEITAQLIIDTSDRKRHTYNVPFNPLVLGRPFEFYMVNKCSSGGVPVVVQWGDAATVRILGEGILRKIPLQFERKSWPSNLAIIGASWFIWNDRKDGCTWDDR